MMVTCKNCKREYVKKRSSGHKGSICNSCARRIQQNKKKQVFIDIAGSSCVKCGYNRCISAIDYHHVNSLEKEFSLSKVKTVSYERIQLEALKCIPLCATCHREYHNGVFKYSDLDFNNLKEYQKKLINCNVAE